MKHLESEDRYIHRQLELFTPEGEKPSRPLTKYEYIKQCQMNIKSFFINK